MLFKVNCRYYLYFSYKEDIDAHSRSKAANELTEKLRDLIATYRKNLQHVLELQKQAHNKGTKPRSYAPNKKI